MSAENGPSGPAPAPDEVKAILSLTGVALVAMFAEVYPELDELGPGMADAAFEVIEEIGGVPALLRAMNRWAQLVGLPPIWSEHVLRELGTNAR